VRVVQTTSALAPHEEKLMKPYAARAARFTVPMFAQAQIPFVLATRIALQ
jgi:hypothetical protein